MRAILLAALLVSGPAMAETITLTMGYVAEPYHMNNPFRTVRIGNPKILDAKPVSDHRLELQPIAPGTTDIAFYNEKGDLMRDVDVVIQEQGLGFLEIVTPGSDRPRSLLYRCSSHGCEYVRSSGLPATEIQDQPAQTSNNSEPPSYPFRPSMNK
jgi:hypothetical protein